MATKEDMTDHRCLTFVGFDVRTNEILVHDSRARREVAIGADLFKDLPWEQVEPALLGAKCARAMRHLVRTVRTFEDC